MVMFTIDIALGNPVPPVTASAVVDITDVDANIFGPSAVTGVCGFLVIWV